MKSVFYSSSRRTSTSEVVPVPLPNAFNIDIATP